MKRDLYAEVSTRIVAELERGAAPWIKPWSATAGQNVPQNAVTNRPYSGCNVILLWLARNRGWPTPRFLTFKQAIEAGGNVRKGEHGTKVYFVKQLQIKDGDGEETDTRLVPMLREYTVFNVDQCENLPDTIKPGKPMRVRNPDTRPQRTRPIVGFTKATSRFLRFPVFWASMFEEHRQRRRPPGGLSHIPRWAPPCLRRRNAARASGLRPRAANLSRSVNCESGNASHFDKPVRGRRVGLPPMRGARLQ